jgi:hypothetical protein
MRVAWLILISALLAGCGSGGATGNGVDLGPPMGPGTAIVKIDTQAASAATVVQAVEFVLHLPSGVTLSVNPADGSVASGVLQTSFSVEIAGAGYQPATASTKAQVRVNIADTRGFTVGNLAALTCTTAPGVTVGAADFLLDGFSAKDENGATIPGVTPHFTVQMQ